MNKTDRQLTDTRLTSAGTRSRGREYHLHPDTMESAWLGGV